MTRFILIICQNSNIRRFCVDNLVTRGYIAVGVASATEGKEVLQHLVPEFIILCAEPKVAESEINRVRKMNTRLETVPILIVSMERPSRSWLSTWNVAAQFPYPIDARRLVDLLTPWLQPGQLDGVKHDGEEPRKTATQTLLNGHTENRQSKRIT